MGMVLVWCGAVERWIKGLSFLSFFVLCNAQLIYLSFSFSILVLSKC